MLSYIGISMTTMVVVTKHLLVIGTLYILYSEQKTMYYYIQYKRIYSK